jgi:hypothetical protein
MNVLKGAVDAIEQTAKRFKMCNNVFFWSLPLTISYYLFLLVKFLLNFVKFLKIS